MLPAMTKTVLRLTVSAGAILAAGATYAILHSVAGIDLAARTGSTVQHVTLAAALVTAALSALAGWGSLALLERLTRRARATWTVIALAVLVLSLLVGPLSGATGAAKAGLALLHLAVAAVVIPGMRYGSR
jgi:hypothetical protein